MRDLLAELTSSLDRGRPFVFCSVVETRGSTPQKAGAAMLVHADGSQSGTLGGGCVEAEVKRRALLSLNEPAAVAEVMSFCLDDDYGWDDGLICGGRMTMLVDPFRINDKIGEYYRTYRELIESGKGCTEIVAITAADVPAGSRYLCDARGHVVAQSPCRPSIRITPSPKRSEGEENYSPSLRVGLGSQGVTGIAQLNAAAPSAEALAGLRPLSERPRPSVRKGFAYLPALPRITLLIVGGGHVGQAVAELASSVDFEIWVLDDREKYASPERFPTAQKRLIGDIGGTLKELVNEIDSGMYCLIVTRGHNHDEEALYHLARTSAGYVGMIGSKRKIKLIFDDLLAKGISDEALAKVHAPLGLNIGSQTVPEIAISIVAELIQRRNMGNS